jgi:hypothetical protein
MTSVLGTQTSRTAAALRRAAVRASLAPSIHNTQPWRFVVGRDYLEIHADWDRQLRVLDPRGRQLIISCGCAVFNARVSLAAAGQHVAVERLAGAGTGDLLARLTVGGTARGPAAIAELEPAVDIRRTNRRQFGDEPVPPQVIAELVAAARAEEADLIPIVQPQDRVLVASLNQQADRQEVEDPAYRAELRAWTTDDPRRLDGVPAYAVPYAGAGATNSEPLPLRVFDTRGMGWLPSDSNSGSDQCLLLLGTRDDGPADWLRAGEALERVLLEIARLGYAASPLTQVIEVARTHELLREHLRLRMRPDVLLRVGRAPETVPTRRRRLVEVLVDVTTDGDPV